MANTTYRGRAAASIENSHLRVTVVAGGGHIAEITHLPTGVNPLWTPPWTSIDPSNYNRQQHPEYGSDHEARLLAGILGHNICLDTFGEPSPEELAAGVGVHGEGPVATYTLSSDRSTLTSEATLPVAGLRFTRVIRLPETGNLVNIHEVIENISASDRAIAWTQHVTLGPPFLERGQTRFRIPATRSKVIDSDFTNGRGAQKTGAEFDWPYCPRQDGGVIDLRVFTSDPVSGGFTTHLMDPRQETAYFIAWSPQSELAFGYAWKREDFPWLCRWEENHLRIQTPWNGQALTCGMEFGVSPTLGSRQEMVKLGSLFGIPAYRSLPAKSRLEARYCAFASATRTLPQSLRWHGDSVQLDA